MTTATTTQITLVRSEAHLLDHIITQGYRAGQTWDGDQLIERDDRGSHAALNSLIAKHLVTVLGGQQFRITVAGMLAWEAWYDAGGEG